MDSTAGPMGRRTVLVGLVTLGGTALGASWLPPAVGGPIPALPPAPVVLGEILATFLEAGGTSRLGVPLAEQVKVRIDGHNTYGQRFLHGTVWWGSGVGRVDLPASTRVRLSTAPNLRPVRGVQGVWRSDDLDGATALDERVVRDLGVGLVVALNFGADPLIGGVRNLSCPISNSGPPLEFYRGYVSRSASRAAVGRAVTAVAGSRSTVLVHCTAGKDRTGWVSDLLQAVAGVPTTVRDADYLATRTYSGGAVDLHWLQAARDRLSSDYGTAETYLRRGCGLSATTYAALRTRLLKPR